MKSIKKLRTVKLSMLGFTVTNDVDPVIFINDDLTPNKLNLLKKAKELQKKLVYQYTWIHNGEIFMRKTGTSKKMWIRDEQVLATLT